MLDVDDTIAAIATAPGGALRGIVRLSGSSCVSIVERTIKQENGVQLSSCSRGVLTLPRDLGDLPVTLYVWPTTKSYTRQSCAEVHLPGSPPLVEAALESICRAGARLARPGEFTLRAFLAGRLDLTQAEAVLGVIDAGSRQQLDAALDQLAGGLARPLAALRERLLDLLAHLEAGLDFVDEDIEFISRGQLEQDLSAIAGEVAQIASQMQARGESSRLPRVVLIGAPNAGKSSLLNALAGDDAAIVSDVAGTTRDFVTRRVQVGNRECLMTDTAGQLHDAAIGELEAAAQDAARSQSNQANLTLFCLDASRTLTDWETHELDRLGLTRLLVWTKCDLPSAGPFLDVPRGIRTSSRTGLGIAELKQAIAPALGAAEVEGGVVAGTAERCRESLRLAGEALARARSAVTSSAGEELVACEVRLALEELGHVVGAVYSEDILDRVFSRFCIGK